MINFGFNTTTKLATRKIPPTIFKKRIIAKNNPIMAWNISGEVIQKKMPTERVMETYTIAFPVVSMAFERAAFKSRQILYSSMIRDKR